MFESTYLFSDIVFESTLDTIDNNKLKEECLLLASRKEGRVISNSGGWQSDPVTPHLAKRYNFTEYTKLMSTIQEKLNELSSAFKSKKIYLSDTWVNINKKGDFNWPHIHPLSIFSGAYYVNIDDIDSHSFAFRRGDYFDSSLFYRWATDSNITHNEFATNAASPKLNSGTLLLFPSYISHRVAPCKSERERISIAFNTMMNLS